MSVVGFSLGGVALSLGYAAQTARWLRVLQREHYEAASLFRFWLRWTWPTRSDVRSPHRHRVVDLELSFFLWISLVIAVVVALVADLTFVAVVGAALYGIMSPLGLGPRGRTSPLQWTRRLRMVALAGLLLSLLVVALGLAVHAALLAGSLAIALVPFSLALGARLLEPYENHRAQSFVTQARERLVKVRPLVVAITGSYGKTSTKNHLADLLSGDGGVVATPKSFNNRAGLSRSINENLTEGTRVFVAEMGTYGPGEIHEMCEWCTPEISVVTAIGPVHLERMKSLDVIERAKFEITERARVVVVNVDDPRLAQWPQRLGGRRVRTAGSTALDADVRVVREGNQWRVIVDGEEAATMDHLVGVQPTNVACAIAAALELGALPSELASRLRSVRAVASRAMVAIATSGVLVIDDTFNANPASARASLDILDSSVERGRRVVVTPGLVELGERQGKENEDLAHEIAQRGHQLVIVGRTNVSALDRGFAGAHQFFKRRDEAVAWVRKNLGPGDAVLYLNDLPDHYP